MSRNTALFSPQRSKVQRKTKQRKTKESSRNRSCHFSPSQRKNHRTCHTMIPWGHGSELQLPIKNAWKKIEEEEERQPQRMWREEQNERERREREKAKTKLLSQGRQQNTLEVEDDDSARNISFPQLFQFGIELQFWNFPVSFLIPENSSLLIFKLRNFHSIFS